ncbi:MAG: hypothetical protein SNJ74_10660 [Fimbriimonadaceae bacterium]
MKSASRIREDTMGARSRFPPLESRLRPSLGGHVGARETAGPAGRAGDPRLPVFPDIGPFYMASLGTEDEAAWSTNL